MSDVPDSRLAGITKENLEAALSGVPEKTLVGIPEGDLESIPAGSLEGMPEDSVAEILKERLTVPRSSAKPPGNRNE
ncbi:hypothetical protein AQF52_2392 [Streptomyces venezuelae]|nr:hypothetical protein AQF52_2392 [Streptomyces venezuelae]CUM41671.1 hypothetical protein BN2537_12307 [Streptomyces venezuelae]